MNRIFLLIISIVCCYLYVSWLPVPSVDVSFYNLILEFVLNPLEFFAAGITFFIGFITNGIYIRLVMEQRNNQKLHNRFAFAINFILYLISLLFLLFQGVLQVSIFFSFAILYGMMTLKLKK